MDVAQINKDIIRLLYEDYINCRSVGDLVEIVAPHYINLNTGEQGAEVFQKTVAGLKQGFPDIHFAVKDLIAEADRVVVRWEWEGTHQGRFMGFTQTGRRVNNTGMVVFCLSESKIVSSWTLVDRLAALQGMGIIPMDLSQLAVPSDNP